MASILATNIERRMKSLGMNPTSLASEADLNQTGVRDIIEGRSKNPRSDTVAKIAKALNCTVAELMEDDADSESATTNEASTSTDRAPSPNLEGFERFSAEVRRRAHVLKLDAEALAEKARLPVGFVSSILDGQEVEITESDARRLARALGCTVDDLAGERPATSIRGKDSIVVFEVHTSSQSGPGGAGDLEISRERSVGEFIFPAASFRQRFGAPPEGVFIDEVGGDSNVPSLYPGQLVMIDSRVRTPYPPGFFLCWDGSGMVLKRLSVVPKSNPPRVQLISDNKQYPIYEVPLEDIEIYGRVIGTWTKL